MSNLRMSSHVISRKPSRADTADERGYRNSQRVTAHAAAVEHAEQVARQELADAIRWLTQACALDLPPGAYVPAASIVRSFAGAAMSAAERARGARRRAARS